MLHHRSRISRNKRRRGQTGQVQTYNKLEPRLPLTTFVVTTATDSATPVLDGQISLREAVIAANTNQAYGDAPAGQVNGDRILFNKSLLPNYRITLTAGELEITEDLLIQGGSGPLVSIDAENNSRHFSVTTNETVGFGKLFLNRGAAEQGGSISSTGGGTINISEMTFTVNRAQAVTTTVQGGGAIFQSGGSLVIFDSFFDDNTAYGSSSDIDGGAIRSVGGEVRLQGYNRFTRNLSARNGGAISIEEGLLISQNEEFIGNRSGSLGSRPGNGGAVSLSGASVGRFQNTEFEGNWSSDGGGAVSFFGSSNGFIADSKFDSNLAGLRDDGVHAGGAIFVAGGDLMIDSSEFVSNAAVSGNRDGGAISARRASVSISNSQFTANTADRFGGAIYNGNSTLQITDSVFQKNEAGLTQFAIANQGKGGAIYSSNPVRKPLSIDRVKFSNNRAATQGGAIWANATNAQISESDFLKNKAVGSNNSHGGGAIFTTNSRITSHGSTFHGNEGQTGGAITMNTGELLETGGRYSSNIAGSNGGAVALSRGSFGTIRSAIFFRNEAVAGKGGAIFVGSDSRTQVFESEFIRNEAGQGGAILVAKNGRLSLFSNNRFAQNTAEENGGAVYVSGYLTSVTTRWIENTANNDGGAVFLGPNTNNFSREDVFLRNQAENFGGAILNMGVLAQDYEFFSGNQADQGNDVYVRP